MTDWSKHFRWLCIERQSPPSFRPQDCGVPYMEMLYLQALSALRFHGEIWLAYSEYLLSTKGPDAARELLCRAIEILPNLSALTLALVELEERFGTDRGIESATKSLFSRNPCAFSFALWQRTTARQSGTAGMRQCFASTLDLRKENQQLCYEVSMAHAQTELEVNSQPHVALRVLERLQQQCPQLCQDMDYMHVLFRVLSILGDMEKFRWYLQQLLDPPVPCATSGEFVNIDMAGVALDKGPKMLGEILSAKEKLDIFDQYYGVELTAGQASVGTLTQLREQRKELVAKVEVEKRKKGTTQSIDENVFVTKEATVENHVIIPATEEEKESILYGPIILLYERFAGIVPKGKLPRIDSNLLQRCSLSTVMKQVMITESVSAPQETSHQMNRGIVEIDELTTRLKVPDLIKQFLYKLPQTSSVSVPADFFVEKLRKVVLPLRPSEYEVTNNVGDLTSFTIKKDNPSVEEEDVFRARQRRKLYHLSATANLPLSSLA